MQKPFLTKAELSARFNLPIESINAQYRSNADQMRKMAEKARKTGKKVNGATADEWEQKAKWFEDITKDPQ